ncbi:DUF4974 domain-containing protein [Chitinophaga horti]|uniref:DUF4974 domain-containing protein n=1 Tax=Chitinophaga horti TaxID=2920382 RepID=A0ABY6JB31_9BACT|nr:FecR family protein [Chitinophaga horti]UYQ95501.1 DUF4974 domain-containing protein [Chitinophaga horti]
MTKEEIIALTDKVVSGTATDEELVLYNRVFQSFTPPTNDWDTAVLGSRLQVEERLHQGILAKTGYRRAAGLQVRRRLVLAAGMVLLLGAGIYWLAGDRQPAKQVVKVKRQLQDVQPPAGNRAVLTLANGQKILLDSNSTGMLSHQGDVTVSGGAGGQLQYSGTDDEVSINTLSVPKGSRPMVLMLTDGTKIWVDAGSSLQFPTVFPGKTREVTVNGQAYFEVAPKAGQPFFVYSENDQTRLEVLGTSFNVKSFPGGRDAMVTLLSGAIKLKGLVMEPGQQVVVRDGKGLRLQQQPNLEQVMAWRSGLFLFEGEELPAIMQELERYYDISVNNNSKIDERFVLRMPRNVPVSEVLKALEMTKLVRFTITGRTVTISDK